MQNPFDWSDTTRNGNRKFANKRQFWSKFGRETFQSRSQSQGFCLKTKCTVLKNLHSETEMGKNEKNSAWLTWTKRFASKFQILFTGKRTSGETPPLASKKRSVIHTRNRRKQQRLAFVSPHSLVFYPIFFFALIIKIPNAKTKSSFEISFSSSFSLSLCKNKKEKKKLRSPKPSENHRNTSA